MCIGVSESAFYDFLVTFFVRRPFHMYRHLLLLTAVENLPHIVTKGPLVTMRGSFSKAESEYVHKKVCRVELK